MKSNILMITAALSILIRPPLSFAAGDSCKREQKGWNPPSVGPLVTWTAPVVCPNELDAQLFFFYNRTRGTFDSEGGYKSFKNKEKKWQWQEMLFLQYGLTDRLEICGLGGAQQNIKHVDGQSAEGSGSEIAPYSRAIIY